jgi:hypothetical protein
MTANRAKNTTTQGYRKIFLNPGKFIHLIYLFSGCLGEWFFEAVHEAGGDSHCTCNLLSACIASKKQASGHPLNRDRIRN